MNICKRVGSLMLSLLLVFSLLSSTLAVQTYAATVPELSAESKSVSPGDQFTVTVNLANATSVYGGNFTLQYDSNLLTADSFTFGSIVGGHTKNCNLDYQSVGNLIRFTFSGASALTSSGTLVTFTFTAKQSVSGSAALKFTSYKMYDVNGSSITSMANGSTITISSKPVVSPSISITNKTVTVGETVSVPIMISNSSDVYGGNFTLQYDSNLLTAESYSFGSIVSGHTKNCNLNYQSAGNLIRVTFSGASAVSSDGTLVTFTFTAKAEGTAALQFIEYKMYDENGSSIATTISNGNVTVELEPAKTLTSISVQTNPTKTTYEIGEALDPAGLTLKLNYSDGSTEIISSGFTTSGFNSSSAGTKTITVTYSGKTTTFNVTINSSTGDNYSGTTGDCEWRFYPSTGIIIISGNGKMGSYYPYSKRPWNQYSDKIKKVIIENGVTNVGQEAFLFCSGLESVELSETVSTIEIEAFDQCDNLTEINLPNSLKSIQTLAFFSCEKLTITKMPNQLKYIGDRAFEDCTSITGVEIPASVTLVSSDAFADCCSLEYFEVDSNNQNYTSVDGNLYNKDKTVFEEHAHGKSDNSFTLPNYVTSLGMSSFYGSINLESVDLSKSNIKSIPWCSFEHCNKLTSIAIPHSVTSIGKYAFNNCKNLSDIYYYGTEEEWSSISINDYNAPLSTANIHYISKSLNLISISKQPTKTTYFVGEALDTTGLQLKLTYDDGSTEFVTNGFTTSGFSSTSVGIKTVTVTYEGKNTTFCVIVNAPTITLSATSKSMKVGETTTLTATTTPSGQSVTWSSSNTSVATVSNGIITAKATGTATITAKFTYNGISYSKTCSVTVTSAPNPEPTLSSISIATKPTKTTYEIGESLNTSGLTLKLTYSDGSTKTVSSGFTTSGFSSATAGTKTVKVTYSGKSTNFTVIVSEPVIDQNKPSVTIERKSARVGSTVSITVNLQNNPGIWGMDLAVNYDKSQLTLTNVTNGTVFSSSEWTQGSLSGDKYILSYEASGFEDNTINGVLATLEFTVNENATADSFSDISLSYNTGDIINVNFDDIEMSVVSGGINITDFIYGDLNGDGLVNKKDSLLMKMYLADNSTVIDKQAADVYADGIINKKDSLYLKQYLAGLDVELGA